MKSNHLLAFLMAALLVCFTAVPPTFAHAVPQTSNPAPNVILDESPDSITIQFNESVVSSLSQIRLLTQGGDQIDVGPVTVTDEDSRVLAVAVPPLADGAYLVSWQVLSAVDGHTTSGTYSFGLGAAPMAVSSQVTIADQLSIPGAIARWLTLTAVALLIGLFSYRLFLWNPLWRKIERGPEETTLDLNLARISVRIGIFALFLLFTSLIIIFIDQNQQFDLLNGTNFGSWLGARFGLVWISRFLLAGSLLFLFTLFINTTDIAHLKGWPWWAGMLLSFGLIFSVASVSHSAALPRDSTQAMLVDMGHVFAATLWVGGLVFLVCSLWLARTLPAEDRTWLHLSLAINFSALAATAVGILAASGIYLAWQHVATWTKLVGTAYGLALLVKLAATAVIMLLAAVNLLYFRSRLNAAYEQPETPSSQATVVRFRTAVYLEMGVALIILLLTGFLTDLQRGEDAPLLTDSPGETILIQESEGLTFEVSITPALVGNNEFNILITDEDGRTVTDIDEVGLRFTYLEQSLGAAEATAELLENERFHVEGSYISLIGAWQLEVSARRPGLYDTFAPYRIEAGVGGNIRPDVGGARPLEDFAQFMTLASTGGTGILLILAALGWGFIATKAAKNEWQLLPLLAISLLAFWLGASQIINFFTLEYTPAKFANNPFLPDVESIAIGQQLYSENCIPCHGPEGRGNGPVAETLSTMPTDFTAGHTSTHPDGDLYYWILNGVEDTQMPAFGNNISEDEAWHLVNYVRRLSAQGQAP